MKQHKSTTQISTVIQNTSLHISGRFGKWTSLSLHLTGAAVAGNILVGLGKLVLGVVSFSVFTCVSALYTLGMVLAKCCAMAGIVKAKDGKAQHRYYRLSGMVLILSSLLFIGYSVRLFFFPSTNTYSMIVGIGIAAVTFTEITLNLRGVIKERRNHTPLIHAIKMINLAASLICLTLTQTAILSFTSPTISQHPAANGLMGTLTGLLATGIGIFMLARSKKMQRGLDDISQYAIIKEKQ